MNRGRPQHFQSYMKHHEREHPYPNQIHENTSTEQPFSAELHETPYQFLAKPEQPHLWPQQTTQQGGYMPSPATMNEYQPNVEQPSFSQYPTQGSESFYQPHTYPTNMHQAPTNQPPTYGSMPQEGPADGWYGPNSPMNFYQPPQTGGSFQGILAQFQDENGQVDVNKMMATVSQFAQTVQQVTPVVKQVSDFIKAFRSS